MGTCLSKNGLEKKKKASSSSSSSSPTSPCQNPTLDTKPSKNSSSFKIPGEENGETAKQTVAEIPKSTIVNQKEGQEQQKCEVGSIANEEQAKPKKRNGSKRDQSNSFDDHPCPAAVVRTSSCTKEEVDAILIQCGRLSRSSSGRAPNENNHPRSLSGSGSKKYSGSKRSYEFHDDEEEDEKQQQQEEQAQPTHRRTPSRERDVEGKRSSSRDRGLGEEEKRRSGRKVSRSPGRRSETLTEKSRPGKTISGSGSASKNNSAAAIEAGLSIKRATATATAIKRTVNPVELGVRTSSSRSRSPATRAAVGIPSPLMEKNIPASLSRNSSRKTDHSPFRRPSTSENDEISLRRVQNNKENEERVKKLPSHSLSQKTKESGSQTQKSDQRSSRTMEIHVNSNTENRVTSKQLLCCRAKDQPVVAKTETSDGSKGRKNSEEIARAVNPLEIETHLPQTITRRRSSRRSREQFFPDLYLDEAQHNHHQQTAFSLPPCVSKACSILEAVADLNSSPFLESEVVGHDDLTEPSFHKYVSVRDSGREMEQQESAGSNSFIHNQWISSWDGGETSADSTDCCASSSSAFLSKPRTGEEVEDGVE